MIVAAEPYSTTQQIGEIAFLYEYEAVLVPNARWSTCNVVILTEHAGVSELSADDGELMDLASWRSLMRHIWRGNRISGAASAQIAAVASITG